MSDEVAQLHEAILNRLRATTRAPEQPAETGAPEPAEYDWAHPRHFTLEQFDRITRLSVQVGEKVSEAISRRLRDETVFQVDPVTQHFPPDLTGSLTSELRYYAAILDEKDQYCGIISLHPVQAAEWIAKILGGEAVSDAAERELTDLEYGLLADILKEMVQGLSGVSQTSGGPSFHLGEEITKGELLLPGDPASEFCRISFRREGAPPEQYIPLVILCEAIEPITIDELDRPKGKSQVDAYAAITAHLQKTRMKADALIGIGEAALQEVLSLVEGDVLLLNRKINEPIELVVDGQPVLAGIPVTCAGSYGLQVTVPPGTLARIASVTDSEDRPDAGKDRDDDRERNQTDG